MALATATTIEGIIGQVNDGQVNAVYVGVYTDDLTGHMQFLEMECLPVTPQYLTELGFDPESGWSAPRQVAVFDDNGRVIGERTEYRRLFTEQELAFGFYDARYDVESHQHGENDTLFWGDPVQARESTRSAQIRLGLFMGKNAEFIGEVYYPDTPAHDVSTCQHVNASKFIPRTVAEIFQA